MFLIMALVVAIDMTQPKDNSAMYHCVLTLEKESTTEIAKDKCSRLMNQTKRIEETNE